MAAIYEPGPVPFDPKMLSLYLEEELRGVSEAIRDLGLTNSHEKIYAEPEKYSEGDVYYADGTSWNPGGGEGLYVRLSTGWSKLNV